MDKKKVLSWTGMTLLVLFWLICLGILSIMIAFIMELLFYFRMFSEVPYFQITAIGIFILGILIISTVIWWAIQKEKKLQIEKKN